MKRFSLSLLFILIMCSLSTVCVACNDTCDEQSLLNQAAILSGRALEFIKDSTDNMILYREAYPKDNWENSCCIAFEEAYERVCQDQVNFADLKGDISDFAEDLAQTLNEDYIDDLGDQILIDVSYMNEELSGLSSTAVRHMDEDQFSTFLYVTKKMITTSSEDYEALSKSAQECSDDLDQII